MPFRSTLMLAAAALAPAAAGASGSGAGAGGLHLVPMAELVVPIVEGARAGGRLRMRLVLRAADPASATRLQAEMPALREATVLAAAEFARLYASPFAPVDAGRLAHDLNDALRARDGGIAQVLLVEVSAARA